MARHAPARGRVVSQVLLLSVLEGGGGKGVGAIIHFFPGKGGGDSDLKVSKTRRPSVGDAFTHTHGL